MHVQYEISSFPIHIPWTHHACTVRDSLQEWIDSRTLMDFDFTTRGLLIRHLILFQSTTTFASGMRMGLATKGTCTTLRCRISLSSSTVVLAWHRTQLMDWMTMMFFVFKWSFMVFDEPNKSKCWVCLGNAINKGFCRWLNFYSSFVILYTVAIL